MSIGYFDHFIWLPISIGFAEQEPAHKNSVGGNEAAEAMASQLHNNHRLQQMASEGYELSAKSIGGRRTPAINNISKVP